MTVTPNAAPRAASGARVPAAVVVGFACFALVMNLLGFVTVGAVLPDLIVEWRLTSREAGLLGGALFGGCAAAVPVLVGLTDRIRPKRIWLACAVLSGMSSALFAILADGFWSAFLLRVITGVGLAGTYMPGLKALSDHFEEPTRTRAATIYTSVFALGTAMSLWVGGLAAGAFGWQWSFAAAAAGNVLALIVGWAFLPAGRPEGAGAGRRLIDIRPVFANRASVRLILGYTGHLWEMFAFRIWCVAFLVAAERAAGAPFAISPVTIATLAALAGVPASMALGETAIRFGRRPVLLAVMTASMVAAIAIGVSPGLPFVAILTVTLVYGIATYGDSGTLSGGMVSVAEPAVRGATMAVYSSAGFFGGLLGPSAVGIAIDLAGGVDAPGVWLVGFAVMAVGSAFAALAVASGPVERRR